MSTQRTPASPPGFPPRQPAELQTVQSRLDLLRDWRGASVATAVVMGALLPFAVAWHVRYEIAIAACAVCAVTLALGATSRVSTVWRRSRCSLSSRGCLTSPASGGTWPVPAAAKRSPAGCAARRTPTNPHTGSTAARCCATVSRWCAPRCSTSLARWSSPPPRPHERRAHTRTAHQRLQPALQPQPLDRRAPRHPDRCACRNGSATALTTRQAAMFPAISRPSLSASATAECEASPLGHVAHRPDLRPATRLGYSRNRRPAPREKS